MLWATTLRSAARCRPLLDSAAEDLLREPPARPSSAWKERSPPARLGHFRSQRAVLILREVLEFSGAEIARMFDTTLASVNSVLQRPGRQSSNGYRTQRSIFGRADIGLFVTTRMFATPWRLVPIRAIEQLAFA
jgi:DNA-directed RNA polymerase specialized sigma24 family protein